MKVIVVKKSVRRYDPDISDYIIGIRESEAEADALIEQDKHKDDHPLMSNEEWCSLKYRYSSEVESLMKSERCSPKRGGWLKKYPVDQISKKKRQAYDELCELSGGMSFVQFFAKYLSSSVYWEDWQTNHSNDVYLKHKYLVTAFLVGTELTLDEYKTLVEHYSEVIDSDKVSYYKEYYDTKGEEPTKEDFNNQ